MKRLTNHLPTIVLASYGLMCLLFCVDDRWHPMWDSGIYLLTARSLANHQGYTYLGHPFFLRPPGFSYFLSWMVGRDGEFDFFRLNFAIMSLAVGTVVVVYLVMSHFRRRPQAVAIALLFGTSPLFVCQLNTIMSEFLFLVLFLSGLALILPREHDARASLWRGLWGALMIAASVYVRTAGIVLLPGLIVLGLRHQTGPRRLMGVAQLVLVLALATPWMVYSSHAASTAQRPATQLLNFTYTTPMLHVDPGDPASAHVTLRKWAGRIWLNTSSLIDEIGRDLSFGTRWRADVASLLVGLGFFLSYRRSWSILEWLTVSYSCLIVLYAYYDSRLVLPLIFLFYHYLLVIVEHAASWCEVRTRRRHLGPALSATVVVSLLSCNVVSMARSVGATQTFPLAAGAEWIKQNTPQEAIILTDLAPELSVLSGRRVYSYLFLRGAPLPEVDYVVIHGQATNFEPGLKERNLGSVVLPAAGDPDETRIYRVR